MSEHDDHRRRERRQAALGGWCAGMIAICILGPLNDGTAEEYWLAFMGLTIPAIAISR